MIKIEDKFGEIPVEKETKILGREQLSINNLDCIHEYWRWDGFYAQSLIFLKEDVVELTKKVLVELSSRFWKGETAEITFSDKGNYVFVNFNFQTEDEVS